MLYRLANWNWPIRIHSAQTLIIGITFYALFLNWFELLAGIIAFRVILYFYRKIVSGDIQWINLSMRILFILAGVIMFYYNMNFYLVIATILIGEIN
jgi:hypothetical protein